MDYSIFNLPVEMGQPARFMKIPTPIFELSTKSSDGRPCVTASVRPGDAKQKFQSEDRFLCSHKEAMKNPSLEATHFLAFLAFLAPRSSGCNTTHVCAPRQWSYATGTSYVMGSAKLQPWIVLYGTLLESAT